jgi:hypothetical protein
MKNDKLKQVSLSIVILVLFSTSAAAFTLFGDISPFFGIAFCDADVELSQNDETLHAEVPAPFSAYLLPLQAAGLAHLSKAFIPAPIIPFLNHISRAPPFYSS